MYLGTGREGDLPGSLLALAGCSLGGSGRPPASTKVALKYPDVLGTTQRWFVTIDDSKDYDTDAEFWRSALGIK